MKKFKSISLNNYGFALISTISVMVLLVLISLAALSLSETKVKTSQQSALIEQARANARMALQLAISELQLKAGADTRVTAPANAVAGGLDSTPQLTGVWRSWEGNDHDKSTGQPLTPDYTSKLVTGNTTDATNTGRFLGWLISSPEKNNTANNPPTLTELAGSTVKLLSEGTLGTSGTASQREVHLAPTNIGTTGSYAWWIQGENTKAFMKASETVPTEDYKWSQRLTSNGRPDTVDFGFIDDTELTKTITRKSIDLTDTGATDTGGIYFHDITTHSQGLLTNTASGGWRRDLSLFSEKWSSRSPWGTVTPDSAFSTFSLEPGAENIAALTLSSSPTDASIYNWASSTGSSMSWNALLDFASLYKKIQTVNVNGVDMPTYDISPAPNDSDLFSIADPLCARIQFILSFASSEDATTGFYTPLLGVQPTFTYYNPYNVAINSAGFTTENCRFQNSDWPFTIKCIIDGTTYSAKTMQLLFGTNTDNRSRLRFAPMLSSLSDKIWKPGESKVLGIPSLSGITDSGSGVIYLDTGYSTDPAYFVTLDSDVLNAYNLTDLPDTTTFEASWSINNGGANTTLEFWNRNGPGGNNKHMSCQYNNAISPLSLPTTLTNTGKTLGNILNDPAPFLTFSLQLRSLFDTDIHTKGYINNKLIQPGGMTSDSTIEESSWDWYVKALSSDADPNLPSFIDDLSPGTDLSSLIGTSHNSTRGLARWVTTELPTQPLMSLCELQHFDVGFLNLSSPRVANALGNSHATPYISSDQITVSGTNGIDHSYATNHVFFDDWFLSSISPDTEPYSSVITNAIDNVLEDFLMGTGNLRNTSFSPARGFSQSEAQDLVLQFKNDGTSWKDVASELKVDGMFNINSTSVRAWTAILKNQKGGHVPAQTIEESAGVVTGSWSFDSSSPSYNSPVPRTTLAGDDESAANDSQLVADITDFSDIQIELLAEEIVKQIKLRGPFLSLSEFMNRQLSTNDDLALAGAVETALMKLAENPVDITSSSTNPYSNILNVFNDTIKEDPSDLLSPLKYVVESDPTPDALRYSYPLAAHGHVAYGTPAWPRQADVLRPIAPILTARDDTFTIRAYGEATGAGGVVVKCWCEAIVVRKAEYVDSSDTKTDFTSLSTANQISGRKFEIVLFRWLNEKEV